MMYHLRFPIMVVAMLTGAMLAATPAALPRPAQGPGPQLRPPPTSTSANGT